MISDRKYEFCYGERFGCQNCGRDRVVLMDIVNADECGADPDDCPHCGSEDLFVYDRSIPELQDEIPAMEVP